MEMTINGLTVVIAVLALINDVLSLSCPECDEFKCRDVSHLRCKGGTTTDACGCCTVCAKVEGEKCGGPWNIAGVCDKGLICVPQSDFYPGQCFREKRQELPKLPKCIQRCKYAKGKGCLPKATVFCNKRCEGCCESPTTCNPNWRIYVPKSRCQSQKRLHGPKKLSSKNGGDYDADDVLPLDNKIKG